MSSYDHTLLGEAPTATRAQLQEGYNVDLLQPPPRRASSVHTPPPPQLLQSPPATVPLTTTADPDKLGTPAYVPPVSKQRASFWRSRTCFIATIVTFLIVIGAVVGGAVGGTISRISHTAVTTASTDSPSASPSSPAPSTSTAETTTQTAQGFGGGFSTLGFTAPTPTSVSHPTSTGGQNTGGEAVANH